MSAKFGGQYGRLSLISILSVLSGLCAPNVSAQSDRVVLSPATGFAIVWDGNNGGYSSPDLGAAAPNNDAAAANGVTTFASSSFAPGGIHDHININDGFYGNSSSWIANFAADPPETEWFVGLAFGKTVQVASIAWGRDNGDT